MKPMQKYLKSAFLLLTSRGRLHWLQKEVRLYESLFQIWSFLTPKTQDGNGQNAKSRLQMSVHNPKGAPSIIYTVYVIYLWTIFRAQLSIESEIGGDQVYCFY